VCQPRRFKRFLTQIAISGMHVVMSVNAFVHCIGISLRRQATSLVRELSWRKWWKTVTFCRYGKAKSLPRLSEDCDMPYSLCFICLCCQCATSAPAIFSCFCNTAVAFLLLVVVFSHYFYGCLMWSLFFWATNDSISFWCFTAQIFVNH